MNLLNTKIKKNIKNNNYKIILSFLILSIFSVILLINTHCILGQGDVAFHFRRVLELKDSILHTHFLPTFSFNQYHGSAIMSLYPYLNLYPIALLSIIIKSKITLLYVWYVLNFFLLFIISYYSSYSINKSKCISYLFSLIYGMSSICFYEGLNDSGEITAFAILPLVLFGCISWNRNNKYIELALGLTFLAFCHVLTLFIACIFIFFWIIFNLTKFNKTKLLNLFKCIGLTICLTSIVWIPAISLKISTGSTIFTPAHPKINFFYGENVISIINLVKQDLININAGILGSTVPNLFALLGIFLSICFFNKLNIDIKKLFWISLIFLIIGSKVFPYKYMSNNIMKLFGIFQTPQRFFVISQLLLSYIFATIVIRYIDKLELSKLNKLELSGIMATIFMTYFYKIIKYHQKFYIIILSILIIMVINFIISNYTNHLEIFKPIFIGCLISVILICQLDMQKQNILQHIQYGHIITEKYFNNHIKNTSSKTGALWLDSINNNNQFKYLINFNTSPTHDYYPKSSISKSRIINNNQGSYNNKHIHIYHTNNEYNTFNFYNKKSIYNLTLPLFHYKNECLHIFLDHHLIKYYINKHSLITLKHVNSGKHIIRIYQYTPLILTIFKCILMGIGILWLIFSLFEHKSRLRS